MASSAEFVGMAHPNKSATQHLKNIPRMSSGSLDMLRSFSLARYLSSSLVLGLMSFEFLML